MIARVELNVSVASLVNLNERKRSLSMDHHQAINIIVVGQCFAFQFEMSAMIYCFVNKIQHFKAYNSHNLSVNLYSVGLIKALYLFIVGQTIKKIPLIIKMPAKQTVFIYRYKNGRLMKPRLQVCPDRGHHQQQAIHRRYH